MNKELSIPFALRAIETHQFAILEENYSEEAQGELLVSVNVGASDEICGVSIFFEVRFNFNDDPLIILEIECQFEVEESAYKTFASEGNEQIIIPKEFCQHLGVITVGTARGVLYEKLKDTEFDFILLPTIDLTVQLSDDIVLTKDK